MKKRAKVHLLPTEPSSAETCIGVRGNIMAYHLAIHHLALSKFYHLYITTDDEIKEGDWFIDLRDNNLYSEDLYVAKTKSEIELANRIGKKIIATTDPELNLPQPSKEFIEEYCRAGGIDEVDVEYGLFHDGNFKDDDETHAFKAIRKPRVNSNNEITIHSII